MHVTTAVQWQKAFARRLFVTDLAVVLVVVAGSQLLRFGLKNATVGGWRQSEFTYTALSIVLSLVWMVTLDIFATRDHKIIGSGSIEYRRVADATVRVFGLLAICSFLLDVDVARGYFLLAFPFGLIGLLAGRWGWRQWLVAKRRRGEYCTRVVLVGSKSKTAHVLMTITRASASGMAVIGVAIPAGRADELLGDTAVLGGLDDLDSILDSTAPDALVLTGSDDLSHRAVQRLSWDLERRGIELVVVPALTDIAGPRIHTTPVAGLPLIHVTFPAFEGRRRVTKRVFDILGSLIGIAVALPIAVVIAIAIRIDSPGPVLFRQQRVGLNGKEFFMFKFRSMRQDAESMLPGLVAESNGNGVLFKMRKDPRVTRVGRVLRRLSMDELPQLLNVVRGNMAFVGPRPPLASEVTGYDSDARRRLLVTPGLTGLWQVSGRSDLSWEDGVRLDLYYVENWSLTGDIIILYRTIRAVLLGTGAY